MTLFPAGCILIALSLLSFTHGNAIVSRGKHVFSVIIYFFFNFNIITLLFDHVYLRLELCGGSLHVENSVVIDIPLLENCDWEIQTDNDHILVFDLVHQDLNFEQSKEFLAV
jgi:hypothetical protein